MQLQSLSSHHVLEIVTFASPPAASALTPRHVLLPVPQASCAMAEKGEAHEAERQREAKEEAGGWIGKIFAVVNRPAKQITEVREWREICAAMDLEEKRAAKANEKRLGSCPIVCLFWGQNIVGLLIEAPLRMLYHSGCGVGWLLCYPCCLCMPAPSLAERCVHHHYGTSLQYWWLTSVLWSNVQDPRFVTVMYMDDVRLNRPPRPALAWSDDPGGANGEGNGCGDCCKEGDCDCCKCEPCDCDCDDCCLLTMRDTRSLLCILSCASSLHLGRCCGPPPAAGCWEDMDTRHARWAKEMEDATKQRTEAFMSTYKREDYTFKQITRSRRLAAHRVAQGMPVSAPPAPNVPRQQAMQRA